jgi:hypothetical protein
MRTNYGVETVDQLDRDDFKTRKEFILELNRLISEYHLSGMQVYKSIRCTKDWND